MSSRFKIARLAAQGDGVADTEKGQVFIPYTLPGEEVTASREKDRGDLIAVLEPSPLRIVPVCRHFADCGGIVDRADAGAVRASAGCGDCLRRRRFQRHGDFSPVYSS